MVFTREKNDTSNPASYPDVSLLMKMCAQRKAGKRQRARRLADLVFKMAARAMADKYAVFKISSALLIFSNFEQIIAYPRRVYEEEAVFTAHIGLKHHNVY